MKLMQRMDRIEARDGLSDARQRQVEEAAAEVDRRLQSYADGFSPSGAHLSESDRKQTMSLAVQLAWNMRFGSIPA